MKLGSISQITIGTTDAEASFACYKALGFELIRESDEPNVWKQIADKSLLLLLNQDGMQYMGMTYFNPEIEKLTVELEGMGVSIMQKIEQEGKLFQVIFSDPEGIMVSLIGHDAGQMFQPVRSNLLNFDPSGAGSDSDLPNPKIGIFGELCYPVKDVKSAVEWWEKLGFEALSVNEQPYPWAILHDGINILGLHQSSHFEQGTLTYFAPGMAEKVARLREEGLTEIRSLNGKDDRNCVLQTPEGQQFFLFSL